MSSNHRTPIEEIEEAIRLLKADRRREIDDEAFGRAMLVIAELAVGKHQPASPFSWNMSVAAARQTLRDVVSVLAPRGRTPEPPHWMEGMLTIKHVQQRHAELVLEAEKRSRRPAKLPVVTILGAMLSKEYPDRVPHLSRRAWRAEAQDVLADVDRLFTDAGGRNMRAVNRHLGSIHEKTKQRSEQKRRELLRVRRVLERPPSGQMSRK